MPSFFYDRKVTVEGSLAEDCGSHIHLNLGQVVNESKLVGIYQIVREQGQFRMLKALA